MTSLRNLRRRRYPYGVLLDEPVRDVRLAEAFVAEQAERIPIAAPLSPWQREKVRRAMQQALLLARWVMHR